MVAKPEPNNEASPEEVQKICELAQQGKIKIDPKNEQAFANINPHKLDFTVVGAQLETTWTQHKGNDGGFCITWQSKSAGFGELHFYNKDGKLRINNEHMSKKFIMSVLQKLVDDAELDDPKE